MKFWNKLTAKQKALSVVGGVVGYFALFVICMFIHPTVGVTVIVVPAFGAVMWVLYSAALNEFEQKEHK